MPMLLMRHNKPRRRMAISGKIMSNIRSFVTWTTSVYSFSSRVWRYQSGNQNP